MSLRLGPVLPAFTVNAGKTEDVRLPCASPPPPAVNTGESETVRGHNPRSTPEVLARHVS